MSLDAGIIAGVLAGAPTALATVWVARAKRRSDEQAHEGDRLAQLEARIDALELSRDEEREKRRAAEVFAHQLRMGLATAVGYVETVAEWISVGAPRPAPALPDMTRLKALLESEHI